MSSEELVLLLGQEAAALAPRLEASGYDCRVGDPEDPGSWQGGRLAVLGAELADRMAELRQALPGVPLLLDLGHDSVGARSRLLRSGATDFWLSSAGASDLLMRLRLHRKLLSKAQPPSDRLGLADLSVVPSRHEVRRGQRLLALTAREYALLLLLIEHRGQVLSREQILRQVWHDQQGATSNVIEVYVRYLRQKLEQEGERRLIHTVRGQGYCLSDGPPQLGPSA
jgi:two-component system response regulator MprA